MNETTIQQVTLISLRQFDVLNRFPLHNVALKKKDACLHNKQEY